MTQQESHSRAHSDISDNVVDEVKSILENLYELPFLENHPLSQLYRSLNTPPQSSPGSHLRKEILLALESLNPGTDTPFRTPHTRLYHLLHMHYVENITLQDAAIELGISERQAYRDLRRAIANLATVFFARREDLQKQQSITTAANTVQAEISKLKPQQYDVSIYKLLDNSIRAVQQLAAQRQVVIRPPVLLEGSDMVYTDAVLAQQLITSVTSKTVQLARPGNLTIALGIHANVMVLTFQFALSADDPPPDATMIGASIMHIAERLRWTFAFHIQAEIAHIDINIKRLDKTLLVIEDNEGVIELLNRLLTGTAMRVVACSSSEEGLRVAQDLLPTAILVDIMMPDMDGWELLQRLRMSTATRHIPVIVCSVIDDPALAQSLGASAFLAKPLTKEALFGTLKALGIDN